jgi:hypothetical protein
MKRTLVVVVVVVAASFFDISPKVQTSKILVPFFLSPNKERERERELLGLCVCFTCFLYFSFYPLPKLPIGLWG